MSAEHLTQGHWEWSLWNPVSGRIWTAKRSREDIERALGDPDVPRRVRDARIVKRRWVSEWIDGSVAATPSDDEGAR